MVLSEQFFFLNIFSSKQIYNAKFKLLRANEACVKEYISGERRFDETAGLDDCFWSYVFLSIE